MRPVKFNLVFIATLSLTLTAGGTAVHFANQPALTEPQDRILDSALTMWTMGTATMTGLLSNRRDDDDA
ncbi:MAG: hypothetical protein F6J97_13515 [Leptolyngbya sp. SIO4C1]|nr:hypothetical protein [Leptolyngbya sp. SIO4C1]